MLLVRRRLARGLIAAVCLVAGVGATGAATFEVDRSHLSIYFAVSHYDISYVRGRFTRIDATVQFDPEAKTGEVGATVDAGSVDTGDQLLDGILRSPQFLDAGLNPEIRFVSERLVFDGSALAAVDGKLWLHGVQRPLRLTVERFVCREVAAGLARRHVCGGAFRATFKRSDFGMAQFVPDVGDEVQLAIGVEATRR